MPSSFNLQSNELCLVSNSIYRIPSPLFELTSLIKSTKFVDVDRPCCETDITSLNISVKITQTIDSKSLPNVGA